MKFHICAEEIVVPWNLFWLVTCSEHSITCGIMGRDAVLTCINIPKCQREFWFNLQGTICQSRW